MRRGCGGDVWGHVNSTLSAAAIISPSQSTYNLDDESG